MCIRDSDKVASSGIIVNEPYWEKYKFLFILLYPSILALLVVSVVWLMRVKDVYKRQNPIIIASYCFITSLINDLY